MYLTSWYNRTWWGQLWWHVPNINPRASSTPALDLICWAKCCVKPQPYKMIQRNIWQRADPGLPWHPGVKEHGCEGSDRGSGGRKSGTLDSTEGWPRVHSLPGKSISRSLYPPQKHTHTPVLTLFLVQPASQSCTPHPSAHTQTHTHCSLHPRVNIISFSDRWEGSDLVENEATNLHPYYTVIHTQLQTCMWNLHSHAQCSTEWH